MASRLKVVLGTMEMGRRHLEQQRPCYEVLDKFFSKGHTEVDTALMYTDGKSEQIIGSYIKEKKPSKIVLATKVNPWLGKSLSADSVQEQVSVSLASLRRTCVHTLYLHAPDRGTHLEETLNTVNTLHQEGKFHKFGLSNYASWEVADICNICKANGWIMPTVYQGMYNALTRMVESELFPCLRHFGLSFYAYNPLAGGILSGTYKYSDLDTKPEGRFFSSGGDWTRVYRERYWRKSVFDGLDMVQASLKESYGAGHVSLGNAALRYLNHHSQMRPDCDDAILIGGDGVEHVMDNMKACEEGPLDERVVDAFDMVWKMDKSNCADYFR